MRNITILVSISIICIQIFTVGCTKVPQKEINAAKDSLIEAKEVEADMYAPDEFKAAADSFEAAMAERSKLHLILDYSRLRNVRRLLQATIAAANIAKKAVDNKKQQIRIEAQALLLKAQTDLTKALELYKSAPKDKVSYEGFKAIWEDLNAIEASLDEVSTLMNKGDFLFARDKASANVQKLMYIIEELQQAINKRSGKVGRKD